MTTPDPEFVRVLTVALEQAGEAASAEEVLDALLEQGYTINPVLVPAL